MENKTHHLNQEVYLAERSQVVPGLDEEGLVDPWVVHIMGCCSHESQEHVQRAQLLCQLQNTHSEETSCASSRGLSQCYQGFLPLLVLQQTYTASICSWHLYILTHTDTDVGQRLKFEASYFTKCLCRCFCAHTQRPNASVDLNSIYLPKCFQRNWCITKCFKEQRETQRQSPCGGRRRAGITNMSRSLVEHVHG